MKNLFPIPAPGLADRRQSFASFFLKFTKTLLACLDGRRSIDGFEISRDFLALFPAYEFEAVARHVNQAELNVCMRKDRSDGVREALEAVHAGDENIVHASIFEFRDHQEPELGTFSLGNLHQAIPSLNAD